MLAVEVRGLVKIYDSKIRALDGVNLDVSAGHIFALLGPNGAGKTTLMRILTTQLKPDAGEAHVFGLDVVKKDAEVRKHISYVPQEMSVWTDITGFENLLIYSKIFGTPAKDRKKNIEEALASMGLADFAKRLVKTYSGGMIRRLEIACALLIKPQILFFDEPTIGLDPSARKAVWEKILTFKREFGTTVFFNTHYMDEADIYSDEIAIIDKGKMVKLGTAESLKRSIQRETIRLSLGPQQLNEGVLSKIRALDLVEEVRWGDSEMTILVGDAEVALPMVVEILRDNGIAMKKISATKPTLDDVFLAYAGSSLSGASDLREVQQVRRKIVRG
jgi:ABC-2 type transport system ATP-binding protein